MRDQLDELVAADAVVESFLRSNGSSFVRWSATRVATAIRLRSRLDWPDIVDSDEQQGECRSPDHEEKHQKKEGVQAHLFVCFLAYVLWKTLEQWQSRAGLGNSPNNFLEELHGPFRSRGGRAPDWQT